MRNLLPSGSAQFAGVVTSGNPITRPWYAYRELVNFRIIPGLEHAAPLLRLRDARQLRWVADVPGKWKQFHGFQDPIYAGWDNHSGQFVQNDGVVKWRWMSLNNWLMIDVLTVNGSYDSNFGRTNRLPVLNNNDNIIYYNGLGVRDNTGSRSPFTMYYPSINLSMYLGIDACVPSGVNPSVASSAGGANTVVTNRTFWVGLYNSKSGHFSNAVQCGTVPAGVSQQFTFSNLQNLKHLTAGAFEDSNTKFVFYSTLDGLSVPYLLLDPAHPTNPLTTLDASATSFVIQDPLLVDNTKEAPTQNFPPRPMRWLAKVNGRLYGALMAGGSDSLQQKDFQYSFQDARFLAGIVYSSHRNDFKRQEPLGDMQQCWPPQNFTPCPNNKVVIWGMESPGGHMVHTFTGVNCYLVEEAADQIHEWTEIPGSYGLVNPSCVDKTPYGTVWVSQRNEIVVLPPGSSEARVLSLNYQGLLPQQRVPLFTTYVKDPLNLIDRFEVHCSGGVVIVHDFASNAGYTFSGAMAAGESLTRQDNIVFHLLGDSAGNLYTQAGQPENGLELRMDETPAGARLAITGTVGSHWSHAGSKWDENAIGELLFAGDRLDVLLTLRFWLDFQPKPRVAEAIGRLQNPNPEIPIWRFGVPNARCRFFRFQASLNGISDDQYYPATGDMGIGGMDASLGGCLIDISTELGVK